MRFQILDSMVSVNVLFDYALIFFVCFFRSPYLTEGLTGQTPLEQLSSGHISPFGKLDVHAFTKNTSIKRFVIIMTRLLCDTLVAASLLRIQDCASPQLLMRRLATSRACSVLPYGCNVTATKVNSTNSTPHSLLVDHGIY
jgi:hypothetical protein